MILLGVKIVMKSQYKDIVDCVASTTLPADTSLNLITRDGDD